MRARCPGRAIRIAAVTAVSSSMLLAFSCSGKQRLGRYDFRDQTLAVVSIAPAYPGLVTGTEVDFGAGSVGEVLRAGSEIAREVEAQRLRSRMIQAAGNVGVEARMAERTLQGAARHLRARPVADARGADFELEIRIREYGLVATSWTSNAYFRIDADMILLDGATGRRIWRTRVNQRDPVTPMVAGGERTISNVITAAALSMMTTEQVERTLQSLADHSADRMVAQLARSLDAVRR